jgi:polyisoprenoid-binding protein YceI
VDHQNPSGNSQILRGIPVALKGAESTVTTTVEHPTRIDMALRHFARIALSCVVALSLYMAAAAAAPAQEAGSSPLALGASRVSIAGTSNIHAYAASTAALRVTRVKWANAVAGPTFWDELVKPGALEVFEIAIPAATLTSDKEGLDKNMHKALKVKEHADITFRLLRLEPRAGAVGALRGVGVLTVAGVPREVALDITTARTDAGLAVRGQIALLMTDFGIEPPKAMLGMLKTDPKVTITFETVLTVPLT